MIMTSITSVCTSTSHSRHSQSSFESPREFDPRCLEPVLRGEHPHKISLNRLHSHALSIRCLSDSSVPPFISYRVPSSLPPPPVPLHCRHRQSRVQVLSLLLMILAASLLSAAPSSPSAQVTREAAAGAAEAAAVGGAVNVTSSVPVPPSSSSSLHGMSLPAWEHLFRGVIPLLVASATSGLASTFNQYQMQVKAPLFTPLLSSIWMRVQISILLPIRPVHKAIQYASWFALLNPRQPWIG